MPNLQLRELPGGGEQAWEDVSAPFISVIVPVRNEEKYIEGLLDELLQQQYDSRRFEIIVADGGSSDRTREVVAKKQATSSLVRLIDNPGRLASAGRNRGVLVSRGDIIVIIDGHCSLANRRYLHSLADAFRRSNADCVGRPQPLDVAGASRLQRAIAAGRASWLGHNPSSHIYSMQERFVPPQSVAVAYRRWVFDKLGLFDEHFDACEDVEFNHRAASAGFRCFFTPQVMVRYHPRGTLWKLAQQMVRYGRGRYRLLKKHRQTFSLACFVPAALVVWFIAGSIAAVLSSTIAALFLVTLSCYAGVVLGVSAATGVKRQDFSIIPLLPLVFLAVHCGAGWGMLSEWLRSSFRRFRGTEL